MDLSRIYLIILAILLVGFSLAGETRGEEYRRIVPEGKEVSGGRTLTWNLVKLPTRPGVTQKILIVRPEETSKGALILFPGGKGARIIRKRRKDGYRLSRNFLVRSAHLFARAGFVGVILDAPSDYPKGMSDDFRQSKEHMKDIRKIVDYLEKMGLKNILLIGTSRGTISAGYLAAAMKDSRVKGVILTSSMNDLSFLPLDNIPYPVLFVHHLSDGCPATEYGAAISNFDRLNQSPRKHFLSVAGGDTPLTRPCGPLSEHGFLGIEKEVVQAIANWGAGKSISSRIHP